MYCNDSIFAENFKEAFYLLNISLDQIFCFRTGSHLPLLLWLLFSHENYVDLFYQNQRRFRCSYQKPGTHLTYPKSIENFKNCIMCGDAYFIYIKILIYRVTNTKKMTAKNVKFCLIFKCFFLRIFCVWPCSVSFVCVPFPFRK